VLTAFAVVLGTLIIQGLTLKPLLVALDLSDGDPVAQEVDTARNRALRAALDEFKDDKSLVAEAVRQEFAAHLGPDTTDGSTAKRAAHGEIHRRAIDAARRTLIEMRTTDEIGDDAFHQLEEDLDWIEMASNRREAEPHE
jgi:NhaP-type Na+/H+ or K+/H+ antiporter